MEETVEARLIAVIGAGALSRIATTTDSAEAVSGAQAVIEKTGKGFYDHE